MRTLSKCQKAFSDFEDLYAKVFCDPMKKILIWLRGNHSN